MHKFTLKSCASVFALALLMGANTPSFAGGGADEEVRGSSTPPVLQAQRALPEIFPDLVKNGFSFAAQSPSLIAFVEENPSAQEYLRSVLLQSRGSADPSGGETQNVDSSDLVDAYVGMPSTYRHFFRGFFQVPEELGNNIMQFKGSVDDLQKGLGALRLLAANGDEDAQGTLEALVSIIGCTGGLLYGPGNIVGFFGADQRGVWESYLGAVSDPEFERNRDVDFMESMIRSATPVLKAISEDDREFSADSYRFRLLQCVNRLIEAYGPDQFQRAFEFITTCCSGNLGASSALLSQRDRFTTNPEGLNKLVETVKALLLSAQQEQDTYKRLFDESVQIVSHPDAPAMIGQPPKTPTTSSGEIDLATQVLLGAYCNLGEYEKGSEILKKYVSEEHFQAFTGHVKEITRAQQASGNGEAAVEQAKQALLSFVSQMSEGWVM